MTWLVTGYLCKNQFQITIIIKFFPMVWDNEDKAAMPISAEKHP